MPSFRGWSASAHMPPIGLSFPTLSFIHQGLHGISLQVSLGFLTAWWLGSKSTIVWLPAFRRTNTVTLLLHSIGQVSFEARKDTSGGKCLCLLVRGVAKDLWPSLIKHNSVPQSCHQTCYLEVKIKQMNPSPALCISLANTPPGCTCVQVSSSFYEPCSEVHWTDLCKSQHRSVLVTIEVFTFFLSLRSWLQLLLQVNDNSTCHKYWVLQLKTPSGWKTWVWKSSFTGPELDSS